MSTPGTEGFDAAGANHAQRLLAVIAASSRADKAALLAALAAPSSGWQWPQPSLPRRPGRPPETHESEGVPPSRRRRTLVHGPTRNRFLLAIHHIEVSAIDLAVLACLRGAGMPQQFHADFLAIARDEARHAGLLEDLLASRGLSPWDEPVHFRLWETALACADLGEHLVAVPRVLEARGLDVSAQLLPRLRQLDPEAGAVLEVIYRDEIRHVAIGTAWQRWWCARAGHDGEAHFATVLAARFPGQHPHPTPLDLPARATAGFTAHELELLAGGVGGGGRECMSRGQEGRPGCSVATGPPV